MKLEIELRNPKAVDPMKSREHDTDTGFDLTAISISKWFTQEVALFDTGIAVEPEEGYYIDVVPRSSMSKLGVSLANSVGVIDHHYRGTIHLPIRFHERLVNPDSLIGKRLCQMVVRELIIPEIAIVNSLSTTKRGSGGFGSTGQ